MLLDKGLTTVFIPAFYICHPPQALLLQVYPGESLVLRQACLAIRDICASEVLFGVGSECPAWVTEELERLAEAVRTGSELPSGALTDLVADLED